MCALVPAHGTSCLWLVTRAMCLDLHSSGASNILSIQVTYIYSQVSDTVTVGWSFDDLMHNQSWEIAHSRWKEEMSCFSNFVRVTSWMGNSCRAWELTGLGIPEGHRAQDVLQTWYQQGLRWWTGSKSRNWEQRLPVDLHLQRIHFKDNMNNGYLVSHCHRKQLPTWKRGKYEWA